MAVSPESPAIPALIGGRPEELLVRIAVLEERLRNRDEALGLQAKEYERRLADLNHAHAQAEEKNQHYITREVYEAAFKEWSIWRNSINYLPAPEFRVYKEATDRALSLREGQSRGSLSTTNAIYAAIGAAVGIGGLAIAVFMRR